MARRAPPPIRVRQARPSDAAAFLRLVERLARYEKLDPPTAQARRRLRRDTLGPRRRLDVLMAEVRGRPVAYAILLETYSSFLARPTLWIEDLYVDPTARGQGVGGALIQAIAQEAILRGCHRIEGVVLGWNRRAQRFYARTGGRVRKDWWLLRYDRGAIEQLAVA